MRVLGGTDERFAFVYAAADRRSGSSPVATMISEVYDAFIAAGTPEDKARKAAEAIANYESRFSRVEADLLVLKWMTGTILGGVVALVLKAFIA
jgi:hypothetical protein